MKQQHGAKRQPDKGSSRGGGGGASPQPPVQTETPSAQLNGIDYAEVDLRDGAGKPLPRPRLRLYFLARAPKLKPANVVITGGRRVTGLSVYGNIETCRADDPRRDDCVIIYLDRVGDASTYTLCLVEERDGRPVPAPPEQPGQLPYKVLDGFHPRYACVDFTFTADCPTGLDCASTEACPPARLPRPEINYLAKDWETFRQLILDRLAVTMPQWRERHIPDIGVTLVELLAYAADSLSYRQDAIATEAYLDTARRRISVRRHARLVDYAMHEGCNARAWVTIECVGGPFELNLADAFFVTSLTRWGVPPGVLAGREVLDRLEGARYEIFEPVQKGRVTLYDAHNRIDFYTWGGEETCLAQGATRATLDDLAEPPNEEPGEGPEQMAQLLGQTKPQASPGGKASTQAEPSRRLTLQPGEVLIFEEVLGPRTGQPADADRSHRHAVRLTFVRPVVDPSNNRPLLEIEWAEDDALPFPLCLSSLRADETCCPVDGVSVARGNIVLVDHGGRIVPDEETDKLRVPPSGEPEYECEEAGRPRRLPSSPARFNPSLRRPGLTYAAPPPADPPNGLAPASAFAQQDPRLAEPALRLLDRATGRAWLPRTDLLASVPGDAHFVVEMDDERIAFLRFDRFGAAAHPSAGVQLTAAYRVGCGSAGNVGAETIAHIGFYGEQVGGVSLNPRNPLPATGGVEPEPVDEARLLAPYAFRHRLVRAITADDYGTLAARHVGVQAARGALRWTGSWYEAHVAVDPTASQEGDEGLFAKVASYLEPYRRIGHDLRVEAAAYAPLRLELTVCVADGYLRSHVRGALLDLFSNRQLPDGRLGLFHPDALSFGQPVRLSALIAAAITVKGVTTAVVDHISRLDLPGDGGDAAARERGFLPIGPFEVARLDNDPVRPENGVLKLTLKGGR